MIGVSVKCYNHLVRGIPEADIGGTKSGEEELYPRRVSLTVVSLNAKPRGVEECSRPGVVHRNGRPDAREPSS